MSLQYYDFSTKESLITQDAPSPMNMNTDLSGRNLKIMNDQNDTEVKNPYGYGYVAPLNEARNADIQEIHNQETTLFALGAVAGVSLIVFGLLISSQQLNPK